MAKLQPYSADAIIAEAKQQLIEETFERRVREEKARLRIHRPWYVRMFPWRITIERR